MATGIHAALTARTLPNRVPRSALNRDCDGEVMFHLKNEWFLADSRYQAGDHCLVPFKAATDAPITEAERVFNRHHRILRSRVERTFAWLDRLRLLPYTEHEAVFMKCAMSIILSAAFLEAKDKFPYPRTCGLLSQEFKEQATRCFCRYGNDVPPRCTVGNSEQLAAAPGIRRTAPGYEATQETPTRA